MNNNKNEEEIEPAVIYARTACKTQKGDTSMNKQVQAIRRFAKQHSCAIVAEYLDSGYSGMTADRPAFKKLLADAEGGKWRIVIVQDFARFARSHMLLQKMLRQLDFLGINILISNSDHNEPNTTKEF